MFRSTGCHHGSASSTNHGRPLRGLGLNTRARGNHNGVDLAAPYGSPIEAADGGTVEQAGWCDCGLGYYVKIDHGDGFETVYGHMSEYYVTPGEQVSKGETIG